VIAEAKLCEEDDVFQRTEELFPEAFVLYTKTNSAPALKLGQPGGLERDASGEASGSASSAANWCDRRARLLDAATRTHVKGR
jgi:hypothetical protein